MVRFIIREYNDYKIETAGFTFQYGLIYLSSLSFLYAPLKPAK